MTVEPERREEEETFNLKPSHRGKKYKNEQKRNNKKMRWENGWVGYFFGWIKAEGGG
jgi:hypothetical protein